MIQGDIIKLHFATSNGLTYLNKQHTDLHILGNENFYIGRDLAIVSQLKKLINSYVIDFTPYTKDVVKYNSTTQTWIQVASQVININTILPIDMMNALKLFNMLCNTNYYYNFTL